MLPCVRSCVRSYVCACAWMWTAKECVLCWTPAWSKRLKASFASFDLGKKTNSQMKLNRIQFTAIRWKWWKECATHTHTHTRAYTWPLESEWQKGGKFHDFFLLLCDATLSLCSLDSAEPVSSFSILCHLNVCVDTERICLPSRRIVLCSRCRRCCC